MNDLIVQYYKKSGKTPEYIKAVLNLFGWKQLMSNGNE